MQLNAAVNYPRTWQQIRPDRPDLSTCQAASLLPVSTCRNGGRYILIPVCGQTRLRIKRKQAFARMHSMLLRNSQCLAQGLGKEKRIIKKPCTMLEMAVKTRCPGKGRAQLSNTCASTCRLSNTIPPQAKAQPWMTNG